MNDKIYFFNYPPIEKDSPQGRMVLEKRSWMFVECPHCGATASSNLVSHGEGVVIIEYACGHTISHTKVDHGNAIVRVFEGNKLVNESLED